MDFIGKRFERLIVLEYDAENSKSGDKRYICKCDCGNVISANARRLKIGQKKSCGCLQKETARAIMLEVRRAGTAYLYKTHNQTSTRLYRIWSAMRSRCANSNHRFYYLYGARGIKVCDEWQRFEPFRDWALSNGYADNLSIDRIDVNGNYEPSNCRWASNIEQQRNKRHASGYTKIVQRTANGEVIGEWRSLAEASEATGIHKNTLQSRCSKHYKALDGSIWEYQK